MATIAFISICDRNAHGLRMMSADLRRHGHECTSSSSNGMGAVPACRPSLTTFRGSASMAGTRVPVRARVSITDRTRSATGSVAAHSPRRDRVERHHSAAPRPASPGFIKELDVPVI